MDGNGELLYNPIFDAVAELEAQPRREIFFTGLRADSFQFRFQDKAC